MSFREGQFGMPASQLGQVTLEKDLRGDGDRLRILCFAPSFVPHRDSEAFCAGKFIQALLDAGADVTVFRCPGYGEDGNDTSVMWERVQAKVAMVSVPERRSLRDSLRSAYQYRVRYFARWMASVVKEAKRRHADAPFDVVYSRSLPMFGHVAGYWSKKELDLPWIANLNDPWDFHLFPVATMMKKSLVDRSISNFWMSQTFSNADLLTFPTARLRDYHFKLTGRAPRSLIVPHVSNGAHGAEIGSDQSSFHLVHAGKLGSNEVAGRPANALLMGLRGFLDQCPSAQPLTRLTLVGPPDGSTEDLIKQLRLESQVRSVGTVNYEESLKHINAASLCILVESKMEEGIYLPSKLVDYLSAGKPVVALSPSPGVVQDLVPDGGIVRIDVDDAATVQSALARLYGDWTKGELQRWAPREAQVHRFRAEVVAGNFLEAAKELGRARRDHKVLSS